MPIKQYTPKEIEENPEEFIDTALRSEAYATHPARRAYAKAIRATAILCGADPAFIEGKKFRSLLETKLNL